MLTRPLAILRAHWRPKVDGYPELSGLDAQALEYAERMGKDALERNLLGSERRQGRIRKMIERVKDS